MRRSLRCVRLAEGSGSSSPASLDRTTSPDPAADGYGLVGGIGQYENAWLMAYVRGPEGIIVSLAERIG